ncbi:tRNA pseudouridine(38-40) synthase TruA [candidate division KSB1 bacterium]|nr:tRNA pseudouridine(38-40) synthase TruA [candidate division KSB1 bacterium]
MRNIKLVLEYDGKNYCGWQYQPVSTVRTIQGELIRALSVFLQEEVKVIAAGRTDTGVHALGQVVNFKTNSDMEPRRIVAALNGTLPPDIRAVSCKEVSLDFNARFDAKKREYRYYITRRDRAIGRYYCWSYRAALDIEQIRIATAFLAGEHDFKSFCKANSDVAHHKCNIEFIEWTEENDYLILTIISNRFLHNMVRNIVGTMVEVGLGNIKASDVKKMLEARDRRTAGPKAPAKGLVLVKVYY